MAARRTAGCARFDDVARWGQPDRCVFCGLPIGPDEPAVGHGESAAHAACADAALGDERLWDGIASAVGGDGPVPGGEGPRAAGDSPVPADDSPVAGDDGRASRGHPPAPGDGGPGSPSGRAPPSADRSGCALVGVLLLAATSAAWRVRH